MILDDWIMFGSDRVRSGSFDLKNFWITDHVESGRVGFQVNPTSDYV